MVYFRCPSCNTVLRGYILKYESLIEEINNNDKLTDLQKKEAKSKVVLNLGLKRYCCLARILGDLDYIKIIK